MNFIKVLNANKKTPKKTNKLSHETIESIIHFPDKLQIRLRNVTSGISGRFN